MAIFNKYPYTDLSQLNLDWFLTEFKKVTDGFTSLEETVQQFTDFVTNYFDNLDLQAEVNRKLNEMAADGTLSALLAPLLNDFEDDVNVRISSQNNRLDILEDRMDTFASLPPGSTAGNAELLDIRNGANGTSWASAGDAVRGNDILVAYSPIYQNYNWTEGYLRSDGTIQNVTGVRYYSDPIPCPENIYINYVSETDHVNVDGIAFYTEEGNYISGVSNNGTSGTEQSVQAPFGSCYCRLSTLASLMPDTYAYYANPVNGVSMYYGIMLKRYALAYKASVFLEATPNRARSVNDLSNIVFARVLDTSYDIALYYTEGGISRNTTWFKEINIANYPSPDYIRLRKSDNSTLTLTDAMQVIALYDTYSNEKAVTNRVAYVNAGTGYDTNTGLGPNFAFATINKAIAAGYKNIAVAPGTYNEAIKLENVNGVHIYCDKSGDNYDPVNDPDNTKIVVGSGAANGVTLTNCRNCVFEDIIVYGSTINGWLIDGCNDITLDGCGADTVPEQGYKITNTNGVFRNCFAQNIGTMGGGQHHDGFNIHGTGTTSFINCTANYCEDDGISHHDACRGFIDGGEWYNCGKGGVASPTHCAEINVQNIYSHDNGYGLFASNPNYPANARRANICNCVFINNTTYDIYVSNNELNIWNTVYSTIDTGSGGVYNLLNDVNP